MESFLQGSILFLYIYKVGITNKFFEGMVWKDIYFYSIYHGFDTQYF